MTESGAHSKDKHPNPSQLADFLAGMPASPAKRFIEIGAGVGLVSIAAASFGHSITLTDANVDALQFARANALINGCPNLPVMELDWNHPQFNSGVDYIVASEVTYRKEDWQPLLTLFKKGLKPGGEVILAGEFKRTGRNFYRQLENDFNIRRMIMQNMDYLGIEFDESENHGIKGEDKIITKPESRVTGMVVKTDEELVIATDTYKILEKC